MAWFGGERLNLLTVIGWACAHGRHEVAGRLAASHVSYQFLQHLVGDAEQMWTVIHDTASSAGDTAITLDATVVSTWPGL